MDPTADEFRNALLTVVPLPEYQWRMLRAHYGAPRHTLTATQLAEAAGWGEYRPVNIWYGKFCQVLADRMGRPAEAADLALILESALPSGVSKDLALVVRSSLVEALDGLCWSWAGPKSAEPIVAPDRGLM